MKTLRNALVQRSIRFGSYPAVMGATALLLVWSLQEELPYYPAVPLIAALGVAMVALLERYFPFHAAWLTDHGDTTCDAVHAVVNLCVLFAVHFLLSALPDLAAHAVWPTGWPVWAQALLAGIVIDFSLFAMHQLSHRVQWLWRFHAIHHSAERLYWLNGERRHPLHAAIMAGPGLAALVLLGAPAAAVGLWLAFLAVHLAFQHSNLDYRVGPLRYVIGTAEVHRWHHKREYEDAQVNFGEFWMVWDHLFRTFLVPARVVGAAEVGLRDAGFAAGYADQLRYPFRSKAAANLRSVSASRQQLARSAFLREVGHAKRYEEQGDLALAWRAQELAHIVAQPYWGLHLRSHCAMWWLAWRERDWREVLAQTARLALTPLGHLSGRLPANNVGTGRVGALESGNWPAELDHATLQRR